jgi:copper(I)-binding protein
MPKPGWTLGIETGDYAKAYKIHGETVTSGARAVTWSGGSLDDAWFDEFVLIGTLADVSAGDTLPFKTVQSCGSGKIGWVELAAEGQDPHSLDAPAPVLTIAEGGSQGHDHAGMDKVTAGNLELSGNWARAMLPNQPTGGGYLTIANNGDAADRLVGASSPDAGRVEIHSMEVVNNVMTMRPVEGGLEIAPGATVELKPGGFHLMFLDVAKPFTQGEKVPVTLQFEKAGEVAIDLPVRAASGGGHDH